MEKQGYSIVAPDEFIYSFESTGAKISIVKVVTFSEFAKNTYNLALLDYNHEEQSLSDSVNSNNGDMAKVLTTVAHIIHDFLQKHPSASIYFEGNSSSRMNLYNRIVKNNYDFFIEYYEISGKVGDSSEPISAGHHYEGFYISNKK